MRKKEEILEAKKSRNSLKVRIKGNKILISMDVMKPMKSNSGKTLLIASSRGVAKTEAMVNDKNVYLVVNAFIYE